MNRKFDSVYFIGGGNMVNAILGGMRRKEWKILVAEIYEPTRKNLEALYGVPTEPSVTEKIRDYDVIVFGIKPQMFEAMGKLLAPMKLQNKLVLTIMAGVTLS